MPWRGQERGGGEVDAASICCQHPLPDEQGRGEERGRGQIQRAACCGLERTGLNPCGCRPAWVLPRPETERSATRRMFPWKISQKPWCNSCFVYAKPFAAQGGDRSLSACLGGSRPVMGTGPRVGVGVLLHRNGKILLGKRLTGGVMPLRSGAWIPWPMSSSCQGLHACPLGSPGRRRRRAVEGAGLWAGMSDDQPPSTSPTEGVPQDQACGRSQEASWSTRSRLSTAHCER